MASRNLDNFLGLDESDDGGSPGYDSGNDDLRKGGRSPKRRRVVSDGTSDIEVEDDHDAQRSQEEENYTILEASDLPPRQKRDVAELPGISKPLTKKNLVATTAAVKRSGVVYLSRVPPFMKPQKLRSLLEPYGTINRIFLSPEDPASHTRRVRNGGNKKRSFTDGWVEWIDKKDAKHACELLNAQIIGGKKGTYYHDDVWNLLYLKGFKWHNLTEQIAAENAERAGRMRAEISKTTKENKAFVQNVERAKMLEGMQSKRAAQGREHDEDMDRDGGGGDAAGQKKRGERARHFKQTAVASKKRPENQPEQVKRVLSKIF